MSKESAVAYLERIAKDKEFRDKVASAKDDAERWDMVKEAGFDFTKEELKQVIQETSGKKLSDAELEQVTGGCVIAAAVSAAGATAASAVGTVVGHEVGGKT